MSGHSKWANIKHRKESQDSKRSKVFQKLATEILVAIKEKGNDPDQNARLRLAIEKAKAENMPNDNIKKLLQKSQRDTSNWQSVSYEGYGPFGIAILVECVTDNLNRTAPQVKAVFNKMGGSIGTPGSVSYLFKSVGIIALDKNLYKYEDIMDLIIEKDVLDVIENDSAIIIQVDPKHLIETKEFLQENHIDQFLSSEVSKIPTQTIPVSDDQYEKIEKIINGLENLDDVQEVYTNID